MMGMDKIRHHIEHFIMHECDHLIADMMRKKVKVTGEIKGDHAKWSMDFGGHSTLEGEIDIKHIVEVFLSKYEIKIDDVDGKTEMSIIDRNPDEVIKATIVDDK